MRIRSVLRRVKRIVLRRTSNYYPIDEWDRQYATSVWSYLSGLEQLPRYAVIEAWRRRFKPMGSVLDLGCGAGVLFEYISPALSGSYTGVDFSQVAIDAAVGKVRNPSGARFICADVLTFEPAAGATFDVIVFNEVLYYLPDPVAAIRRYLGLLAPGGLIIVSVYHENRRTWRAVSNLLAAQCLQTIVMHEPSSGKSWYLGVYQIGPDQR